MSANKSCLKGKLQPLDLPRWLVAAQVAGSSSSISADGTNKQNQKLLRCFCSRHIEVWSEFPLFLKKKKKVWLKILKSCYINDLLRDWKLNSVRDKRRHTNSAVWSVLSWLRIRFTGQDGSCWINDMLLFFSTGKKYKHSLCFTAHCSWGSGSIRLLPNVNQRKTICPRHRLHNRHLSVIHNLHLSAD